MKRTHNMIGRNNADSLHRNFNNAGFGMGLCQLKDNWWKTKNLQIGKKREQGTPKPNLIEFFINGVACSLQLKHVPLPLSDLLGLI